MGWERGTENRSSSSMEDLSITWQLRQASCYHGSTLLQSKAREKQTGIIYNEEFKGEGEQLKGSLVKPQKQQAWLKSSLKTFSEILCQRFFFAILLQSLMETICNEYADFNIPSYITIPYLQDCLMLRRKFQGETVIQRLLSNVPMKFSTTDL